MRDVKSKGLVLMLAYGPAVLCASFAVIPVLNSLYSGHGGPAWLFLPLAFPFAMFVLWSACRLSPIRDRPAAKRFALISVAVYAPASLLASFAGTASIKASFGLDVSPWEMWALFLSPFGFPAMWLWDGLFG